MPPTNPTTVISAVSALRDGSINHYAARSMLQSFVASDRTIGISIKVRLLSHRQTALFSRVKETINGHPNASKGFNYLFGNKNVVYWDLLKVSNYPPRLQSAGSANMLHCEYRVCKNKLNRVADIPVRSREGHRESPLKLDRSAFCVAWWREAGWSASLTYQHMCDTNNTYILQVVLMETKSRWKQVQYRIGQLPAEQDNNLLQLKIVQCTKALWGKKTKTKHG